MCAPPRHTLRVSEQALEDKAPAPEDAPRPRGPYGTKAFYRETDKCTSGNKTYPYTPKGMVQLCHSLHTRVNQSAPDTTHRMLQSATCMRSKGCQEMCIEMLECPYLQNERETKRLPDRLRHQVGEVLDVAEGTCQECAGQYWNTRVHGVGASWNNNDGDKR